MRQKVCSTFAAMLLAASLHAAAQPQDPHPGTWRSVSPLPLDPSLYGVEHWHVGESAQYILVTYQGQRKSVKRLRYAILGEQSAGRSIRFVVETQATELDDARRSTVNSVARPFGDLTNLLEGATGDLVMKQDASPARSIPISVLKERLLPFQTQSRPPKIISSEILGGETVETPAGRFKTLHRKFHFDDGRAAEIWSTGRVGPLGLVKVVSKDFSLTLTSHQQKRSVSAITEIPTPALNP